MHGGKCLFLVVVVSLTVGCTSFSSHHSSATPAYLRGTPADARKQLLSQIPIGTPRDKAYQIVKSLGLELTPQSQLATVNPDTIECRHVGPQGLFSQTTWLIRIDCQNGNVADILCEPISVSYW